MKGIARTNAFRVKDEVAFRTWAYSLHLKVRVVRDSQYRPLFMLSPGSKLKDGLFPTRRTPNDTDGANPVIDYAKELSAHLEEGEIAVITYSFVIQPDCIGGGAKAITWDGRSVSLNSNEIYQMAIDQLEVDPDRLRLAHGDGLHLFTGPTGKAICPPAREPGRAWSFSGRS